MTTHDLVVLGGGSAGLSVAVGAAELGLDVALCDPRAPGGECTWTGCIPSKTLIDVARRAHEARSSVGVGVVADDVVVDGSAVMRHVRGTRHTVAEHEDEDVLDDAGVTFHRAAARFVDSHTLAVGDTSLAARRFVVATGSRPRVPAALAGVPHLTSDTVWDLDRVPERLVVVGGGPVGVELGQAFRRLGSEVVLVTEGDRLLPDAHPEASRLLRRTLEQEGTSIVSGRSVTGARPDGSAVVLDDGRSVPGSDLLVATGTTPVTDDLDLETIGVRVRPDGAVSVDARLRTTRPHIHAVGDVIGAGFTHEASAQAASALRDMLLPFGHRHRSVRRWAVFTDPEIAQVGRARSPDHGRVVRLSAEEVDRSVTGAARRGFVDVAVSRLGRIEGATIVGPHAADAAAVWAGLVGRPVPDALEVPTVYPTAASATAAVAHRWSRDLLRTPVVGPTIRSLVRWWWSVRHR
ncbi:MAG: NAD(P)/FAD-dependent oxidoreductase [Acidimicrobiia bacterium]|nr:NAD(P)/FAD-dependent oxidoreductase [Acidimicrobiia bacterium]